jgi:hypothetical protein
MLNAMVERNAGPGKGCGLGAYAQASGEEEEDGDGMVLILVSGHYEGVGFQGEDETHCVMFDAQQGLYHASTATDCIVRDLMLKMAVSGYRQGSGSQIRITPTSQVPAGELLWPIDMGELSSQRP